MEISKIDKNFATITPSFKGKFIPVPSESVMLHGLLYSEEKGFYRLPFEVADKLNDGVKYLHQHTAGGRISFSTNSKNLAIHVTYDSLDKMHHMPMMAQAGFSLCEMIKGKETHIHSFSFSFDSANGYSSVAPKQKGNKVRNYVLHFPLYNRVKSLTIEIDKGAEINPFNPYMDVKPIIYYGSSITQGGCASRSDHSYQGLVAKWIPVDFVNFGFSGSCKGELEMAKYISTLECSVFVMDYDHNTPTPEYLKSTHEPFFLEFRKSHPTTPVIFMSAPSYHYDPKGLRKRLNVVKETYLNAVARGDKNVYFIDGSKIYPNKLNHECSVDGCHPNDLGFYFMALKVSAILKKIFK